MVANSISMVLLQLLRHTMHHYTALTTVDTHTMHHYTALTTVDTHTMHHYTDLTTVDAHNAPLHSIEDFRLYVEYYECVGVYFN